MAFDPNTALTAEGRLDMPDGADATQVLSDCSDGTSTSDGLSSDSSESGLKSADARKRLKEKLKTKIRNRAQARERGATPVFKKRDYFNFVKCGMAKNVAR